MIRTLFAIFFVFYLVQYSGNSLYKKVKEGKATLICYSSLKHSYVKLPPERVTGYFEDRNLWTFDNGYSSDCQVFVYDEDEDNKSDEEN